MTRPYLRDIADRNVQAVDNLTYAQHMLNRMQNNPKYKALDYVTKNSFETGAQFTERLEHTQALYVRNNGALCIGKQKSALAGADMKSAKQYKELLDDLLKIEGIMRYQDAYSYAQAAINDLPEVYTDLFSSRFQYVFIDEYQDCDDVQRQAIDAIFNSTKCTVIKIGDSNQAIYNSSENETPDWVPQDGFLPIMTSCRYSQEIADAISKLKKDPTKITTNAGKTGVKPILLIFDTEKIDKVIGKFVNVLETHGLYDNKGVYKAIGAAKKEDLSGLKIGSYWSGFDGSVKKQSEYNYWALVDDVTTSLLDGNMCLIQTCKQRTSSFNSFLLLHPSISESNPFFESLYTRIIISEPLYACIGCVLCSVFKFIKKANYCFLFFRPLNTIYIMFYLFTNCSFVIKLVPSFIQPIQKNRIRLWTSLVFGLMNTQQ